LIGIVLISHSRKLAEGVLDLAREMGGEDLNIIAVGGVGKNDDSLGTTATSIHDAIEKVFSNDGVLVLMDLGSAVINAEFALEMMPKEKSKKVYLCGASLVEGAVAAAVQVRIGASLDKVFKEAQNSLAAKQIQLGVSELEINNDLPPTLSEIKENEETFFRLVINNPVGLHARPAARFVEKAGSFPKTNIFVTNITRKKGPVSGKSIIRLTALGVRQGDEIQVTAVGDNSNVALEDLRNLLETQINEK